MDFDALSTTDLVGRYNQLVADHSPEGFRPVKRFASRAVALQRCKALGAMIQEIKPVARPKRNDPERPTITQMTATYNEMVPEAVSLGIDWARHHSSNFESHAGATKATEKLAAAIAEAKKAKAAA